MVAAGVPGAGGRAALFVVYVKGPETEGGRSDRVRDEIGELWRRLSVGGDGGGGGGETTLTPLEKTLVCPLAVRAAGYGSVSGLCESDLAW